MKNDTTEELVKRYRWMLDNVVRIPCVVGETECNSMDEFEAAVAGEIARLDGDGDSHG